MKARAGRITIVVFAITLGMLIQGQAKSSEPQAVSLISVIASPEAYDGHRLQVVGVLQMEFEQDLLYLSMDDFDNKVVTNALRMSIPDKDRAALQSLSGRYVGVDGFFSRKQAGRQMIQVGRLQVMARIELWAPTRTQR